MQINIELTEIDLKRLVLTHIESMCRGSFDPKKVKIETKSNQNYRSEWESGAGFRATYQADV